tara:strand:+ start:1591 stop:1980 length:390 start_codon:yes stop_codon:yes gene_type:complete
MTDDANYSEAVAYFNRSGKSSADGISYAYDSNKNVLIQHHKNIQAMGGPAGFGLVGGMISGTFMANSIHNAFTAPTEEARNDAAPDVSVGLSLFFAFFYFGAAGAAKRTIKAVDREVAHNKRDPQSPIM